MSQRLLSVQEGYCECERYLSAALIFGCWVARASATAEQPRGGIAIARISQIRYPSNPAWSPVGKMVALLWDATLKRQNHRAELRYFHLVPAVNYIQASRIRMLLMQDKARMTADVDLALFGNGSRPAVDEMHVFMTNITGHPGESLVAIEPDGLDR